MGRRGESIYHRKDGLWEARYLKEITPLGKKKYASVYGHSYREAKEKRQDALDNQLLFQRPTSLRKFTVSELANEYLYVSQNRIKTSTLQRYKGILKNHITPVIGHINIIYLSTIAIHEYSLNRLEAGLAPQTINTTLIFLKACLKYGHRQYKFPLPDISYLSETKKEKRVLSVEEQRKLVAYLSVNPDIYKFGVLLTLYTGLRIGELCALKWSDIENNCIKVRKTMQRLQKSNGNGTELFIGAPKTETSIRCIPIPSFLIKQLAHFRELGNGQEYFLGEKGQPIAEPRIMQYKFKKYLEEAGVEKANFHALRHSFATRCVEVGFDIKSLCEILGHASVQTTLSNYVHSSFELKQSNMELLSKIS